MKKTLSLIAALGLTATFATQASADYPDRPIEMIVAYGAGGSTDVAARTLIPFIEKHLGGATITVVNTPGAGGEIGFTALSQAEPDGYTIGFINTPNILTIPIARKARYSTENYQAVANIVYDPGAFSVLPGSDFSSLDELVAFAKENPRVVTYATTGIGGDDHLAALNFSRLAGIEMIHIPFSGSADVRAALLGGHVKMAVLNISASQPLAAEGQAVVLGQMGHERWENAPDVPTFKEQGYDVVMGSDRGIGAPTGFPDDALNILQAAIAKAVADPEFVEAAAAQNLPLSYQTAEEFQTYLDGLGLTLQTLWDENPWTN